MSTDTPGFRYCWISAVPRGSFGYGVFRRSSRVPKEPWDAQSHYYPLALAIAGFMAVVSSGRASAGHSLLAPSSVRHSLGCSS